MFNIFDQKAMERLMSSMTESQLVEYHNANIQAFLAMQERITKDYFANLQAMIEFMEQFNHYYNNRK